MKGESGSIVTTKLNKIKKKVLRRRGKSEEATNGLAATSNKFSSNGSLLSHNGLKAAYSEPDMQQHENVGENGQGGVRPGGEGDYVHMNEGKLVNFQNNASDWH